MTNCPKCGKEFDGLNRMQTADVYTNVFLDEDDTFDYTDQPDLDFDGEKDEFRCAECDALIATNEQDAVRVLKGKKVEKNKPVKVKKHKRKNG